MKAALELFSSRFTPPLPAEGGAVCLSSLTGSADAFLALALAARGGQRPRLVLAVTPGLPDADRLADDLRILAAAAPNVRLLEFPPLLADDKSSLGLRIKTLAALRAWSLAPYPCILVAAAPALATPVPTGVPPSITLGTDPIKFEEICNAKGVACRRGNFDDLVKELSK